MSSIVRASAVRSLSVAAVLAVTQVAWAAPATGEFSAVDQVEQPAADVALTRADAHVRMLDRTATGTWTNGEVVELDALSGANGANGAKGATPMDVRAQGRQALRSHTLPVGDVSL